MVEKIMCPACHNICLGDVRYVAGFRECRCQLCGYEFMHSVETNRRSEPMIFKKRKQVDSGLNIEDVNELIQCLRKEFSKEIDELKDKNDRLHRIIKYSSDKPTYKFGEKHDPRVLYNGNLSGGNTLKIYVDKEEYEVYLSELNKVVRDKNTIDFRVDNNLVYFSILGKTTKGEIIKFDFVIDYTEGKYVVSETKTGNTNEC